MHWSLFFASLFAGLRLAAHLAAFGLLCLAFALPWIIMGA